jgi:EAL domain-containing protein (putative c-di-GMP-specific phosphodiesterase class I)
VVAVKGEFTVSAAVRRQDLTLPSVNPVYQPIVDLMSGDVVAFEALARGPAGSPLESPVALFAHARTLGLEQQLDLECQALAMRGALRRRLPAAIPLFVNAEPNWLHVPWPHHLTMILEQARDRLQIVVEITERALVADPANLLGAVERIRDAGWGIALDDVGADPASLALMPFIEPDVIKLDLRLIQERTNTEIAGIVNAVIAQAERTGALILAEGIETEEHRARAVAMGATLGQGWLLGRPAALPDQLPAPPLRPPGRELTFTRPHPDTPTTPFDLAREALETRPAAKRLLLPMSLHLERHALRTSEAPVLLAAFQNAGHFTPATLARYESLAAHCSLIGVMGHAMKALPATGVRGASLNADDPLCGEWTVCVVGPHFSGALIATDLGDTGPDAERRFAFAMTYNRALVLGAARSLLHRISGPDAESARQS